MISRAIRSIGLEVECGINEYNARYMSQMMAKSGVSINGLNRTRDSTVSVSERDISNSEIRFWSGDMDEVGKAVAVLFGDCGIVQNRTCGNHIHIKFSDWNKASVMLSKKAWEEFAELYSKRFSGSAKHIKRMTSQWCSSEYKMQGGKSYMINHSHVFCYGGTVELRIMPYYENAQEAIECIKWAVKTVNDLVVKYSKIADKLGVKRICGKMNGEGKEIYAKPKSIDKFHRRIAELNNVL